MDPALQQRFRRWHLPWKERVAEEARPFSHGTIFRSPALADYWEFNCIRVERAMDAAAMVAAADAALADCPHRLAEWIVPMDPQVVTELRQRGWIAHPLVYMLHDGRRLPEPPVDLREVDYDAVRHLRDLWHREDFGDHVEAEGFHGQARQVAERAAVRVLAAFGEDGPIGFAQVQTHDGGSEITEVYVHPDHRARSLGTALTTRAIRLAAEAASEVWICAERDNRPRRLYERLGFRAAVETGAAILPPAS